MESDFVASYGVVFPERISGTVTRVAAAVGPHVKEWFNVWPEGAWPHGNFLSGFPDGARVVDVRSFRDEAGWDQAVIYRRPLIAPPGGEAATVAFQAPNLMTSADEGRLWDLSGVEPLAEDQFWALMTSATGDSGVTEPQLLLGVLVEQEMDLIHRFWVRMQLVLDALAQVQGGLAERLVDSPAASTSGLWSMLAVVARGRETYDAALQGPMPQPSDAECELASDLEFIAEHAIEHLEGYMPVFGRHSGSGAVRVSMRSARPSKAELELKAKFGDGTKDLLPGPRTAAAMTGRGLSPRIVCSRFVVSSDSGLSECLAVQRIDTYRENTLRHVNEAAHNLASSLGGVVSSPIEYIINHTLQLSGFPVFQIKRKWQGSLDEYCVAFGLTDPLT